jgi:hypothetical protein
MPAGRRTHPIVRGRSIAIRGFLGSRCGAFEGTILLALKGCWLWGFGKMSRSAIELIFAGLSGIYELWDSL